MMKASGHGRKIRRVKAGGCPENPEKGACPMVGGDLTEYEKRLAADHERHWRALTSFKHRECRRRKCRRDGACTGPMRIAPCFAGRVKAQQAIGLSGKACAGLPICLARFPPEHVADLEAAMDAFRADLQSGLPLPLPKLDRCREQTPQTPPDP